MTPTIKDAVEKAAHLQQQIMSDWVQYELGELIAILKSIPKVTGEEIAKHADAYDEANLYPNNMPVFEEVLADELNRRLFGEEKK